MDSKKIEAYEYGRNSETKATQYLENIGWCILERNFRTRFSEIDLIAMDGVSLVFVEVRSRRAELDALESIQARKLKRILRGARYYLAKKSQEMPSTVEEIRFDFLAVEGERITRHIRGQFFL